MNEPTMVHTQYCYHSNLCCPVLQSDWPRGFRPFSPEPLDGFISFYPPPELISKTFDLLFHPQQQFSTLNVTGQEVSGHYLLNHLMDSIQI